MSVAVNAVLPLTVPRSWDPLTDSANVYQVPVLTVNGAEASVVDEPDTSRLSSTVLLLRRAR